ncbi:hypothetical protein HOE425_331784 [Hoeflea sp. EC-HK425]|nr:hypothetical protein HOE425_331784 [Hoeflea sp. EC-HK425]
MRSRCRHLDREDGLLARSGFGERDSRGGRKCGEGIGVVGNLAIEKILGIGDGLAFRDLFLGKLAGGGQRSAVGRILQPCLHRERIGGVDRERSRSKQYGQHQRRHHCEIAIIVGQQFRDLHDRAIGHSRTPHHWNTMGPVLNAGYEHTLKANGKNTDNPYYTIIIIYFDISLKRGNTFFAAPFASILRLKPCRQP